MRKEWLPYQSVACQSSCIYSDDMKLWALKTIGRTEQTSLPPSQSQLAFPHPRANFPSLISEPTSLPHPRADFPSPIPEPTSLPPSQSQLPFPYPRANFPSPIPEPTSLPSSQSQLASPNSSTQISL
ncbi:hypothetical protein PoB_001938900 [Plakobranchus ocellatus]|uniref:Uncharacterized protein n=1 Tax=Plakobranchus ocellatus TaxID=259542 RepID=A0AAV3ZET5_9GAST|nr:hypothetical protein PoB_001938900 [Plakobranchus ocellatus]